MANLDMIIRNTLAFGQAPLTRTLEQSIELTLDLSQEVLHILIGVLEDTLVFSQSIKRILPGTLTHTLSLTDENVRSLTMIVEDSLNLTTDNTKTFDSIVIENTLDFTDNVGGTINVLRDLGTTGDTIFDPTT